MTGEPEVNGTPTQDGPEPGSVVAAMASAIERVRSMAKTVFDGDADLFSDSSDND